MVIVMEVIKMKYHLNYKHINPKVIIAIRKVITEDKIFKKKELNRVIVLMDLKNKLCDIYNIDKNKIPHLYPTKKDGYYNPIKNGIYINRDKLSLITFLHEFKHFLQHYFNKTNSENIARGYSLSAFYQASPKHFKRALEKGLILHQIKDVSN